MPSWLQSRFWQPQEGDHTRTVVSSHRPDLLSAQPMGRDAAPAGRVAGAGGRPPPRRPALEERAPTLVVAEEGRSTGTPAGIDVR